MSTNRSATRYAAWLNPQAVEKPAPRRTAEASTFLPSVLLARFQRARDVELRIELSGVRNEDGSSRRFINCREWTVGQDGTARPTPRGLTIRMHEIPELLAALYKVLDVAGVARVRELLGAATGQEGGSRG